MYRYVFYVYDEYKYSDTFWLADRTRLFVQYTISLSSLCKLIWRHWTNKMPVRYILSSVWIRLSIFSPLSIIQYVGLYVFSLPISLVMFERIHILCLIIIIKSEVWTITHCLGLGHETMVSAVCLSIFFSINQSWVLRRIDINVKIFGIWVWIWHRHMNYCIVVKLFLDLYNFTTMQYVPQCSPSASRSHEATGHHKSKITLRNVLFDCGTA